MTDSVSATTQTTSVPTPTASSANETVTGSSETTVNSAEQTGESTSALDTPAVVIRNVFDDSLDIVREFERSQERREDRDEGTSTPIERARDRQDAAESRIAISEQERSQIILAAQQASAQLSSQLATTLSNGLASALDFYQGFNERRSER